MCPRCETCSPDPRRFFRREQQHIAVSERTARKWLARFRAEGAAVGRTRLAGDWAAEVRLQADEAPHDLHTVSAIIVTDRIVAKAGAVGGVGIRPTPYEAWEKTVVAAPAPHGGDPAARSIPLRQCVSQQLRSRHAVFYVNSRLCERPTHSVRDEKECRRHSLTFEHDTAPFLEVEKMRERVPDFL